MFYQIQVANFTYIYNIYIYICYKYTHTYNIYIYMYQIVDFLTSLLTPINRTRDSGAPVQARNVVVQAFH